MNVPATFDVAFNCVPSSGVPNATVAGAGQVTIGVTFETRRSADALLAAYTVSPAKLAETAPGCVPALRPARLTPVTVATPNASVIDLPAGKPLSVRLTSRSGSAEAPTVNVADKEAVPP